MKKLAKIVVALALSLALIVPSVAEAGSFGGGSSSKSSFSSSSSSRSSISNSSRSSYSSSSSRSFSGSSSSRSSSKPSVSLTKPSTSTKSSFSDKTSTKSSTTTYTSRGSFSGAPSANVRPTVRGKTYTSTPTRRYYNGRNVQVNHYYNAGFAPSGWFGYFAGFSTGMFLTSLAHPWGYAYQPVGHPVTAYGASPISWIIDIFLLVIFAVIVIAVIRAFRPSRKVYRRKF